MNLPITQYTPTSPLNGEASRQAGFAQVWSGVRFAWQLRRMKRTLSRMQPLFSVVWENLLDTDRHVAIQMLAARVYGLHVADAIALKPVVSCQNGHIVLGAGAKSQHKILLNTRLQKQTMQLLVQFVRTHSGDSNATLANPLLTAPQNLTRYGALVDIHVQRLRTQYAFVTAE
ncbi:hypothetical protein ACFQAT_25705 [Undibacterium arcticum]|uniref:Uncharacterized protein n=1 Tax=Undibacterium arcticum TaxID=1762892 RepID=A0ABV7F8V3_9BURK